MPAIAIQIGLAAVTASVSAGVGWWLRGILNQKPTGELPEVETPEEEPQKETEAELKAKEALSQLHMLTEQVAADVGAHSDSVKEISEELAQEDAQAGAVAGAVAKLLEANQKMQQQLEAAEGRLAAQAEQMECFVNEARTDALTGVPNRRAFDEFSADMQEDFAKTGRPVCVFLMDVDKFKNFNDTHGHQAGDEVLKGVAKTLDGAMRDKDLVARYGGEEFATIFPGTTIEEASRAAERARTAIEEARFDHEGTQLKVTASFGVAQLRDGETMEETAKRADDALYAAKEAGRNNAHYHDGRECLPVNEARNNSPAIPQPTDNKQSKESDQGVDYGIDNETGLSNRRAFKDDVFRRVAEWKRGGATLSLILVGVDDLPGVIDKHGPDARPMVLDVTTKFLKAAMRDMDHVARFNDDTFALLLPGSPVEGAMAVSERLRNAISQVSLPLGDAQMQFTVSMGTAEARRGDDYESLVQRTESALTTARTGGSNRSYMHDGKNVQVVEANGQATQTGTTA